MPIGGGTRTADLAAPIPTSRSAPPPPATRRRSGRSCSTTSSRAWSRRHPEVGASKARLLELGAVGAVMTGSGSSVVGLARDREHAEGLAASFPEAVVTSGPPSAERG